MKKTISITAPKPSPSPISGKWSFGPDPKKLEAATPKYINAGPKRNIAQGETNKRFDYN